MTTTHTTTTVLAQPLALPCGLVLPNRIMKAAMGEGLADPWTSDVTPALIRLYERWADGGAGTLITGVLYVQRGTEDNVPSPSTTRPTPTRCAAGPARCTAATCACSGRSSTPAGKCRSTWPATPSPPAPCPQCAAADCSAPPAP